jgi:hypothetical protein
MHRKLIHSVRALGITLSLLTAGLFLAGFLAGPAPTPAPLAAAKTPIPTTVEVTANANAAKAHSRHRRNQARDAMALPFFSFAQALRRGNRS